MINSSIYYKNDSYLTTMILAIKHVRARYEAMKIDPPKHTLNGAIELLHFADTS